MKTIWITSEITTELAPAVIEAVLSAKPKEPILVWLVGCPGGCYYSGMAIYDVLRSHSGHVTTHATGLVASMGVAILQAGDTRKIRPHGTLVTHVGGTSTDGDYSTVLAQIDFERRVGIPALQAIIPTPLMSDRYFSAEEALAEGLVDVIE